MEHGSLTRRKDTMAGDDITHASKLTPAAKSEPASPLGILQKLPAEL